ncbi:hypothetical protein GO013_02730 [Pseudodesulfovibrio sp. JC047]|uniref:hypothetical protein n=1 Tax=Pseudodesulfovibrio sp. JC047 TaxID=2683199 RepID=UPI0013D442A3|nr:hypothetical protein [Pseudodesulfovibrio sp. JC047]NDV18331.1 hypothetical protein [Pseudodesulfovibrio sp. JC047]
MAVKPLKAMIAQAFATGETLDAQTVHAQIESLYRGEKYCSVPTVADHLKSLKAVGILREDSSFLNDAGMLVSQYRISDYGLNKVTHSE